ncbi:unnamed protein product [Adineta ricciae]|uniref:Uncharacterized protein n=1 Tax=Adineta ricciae TaxID=249248 RepID=A0A815API4_ADIRI|nr:unnamed protein product [Adineta ricciae]
MKTSFLSNNEPPRTNPISEQESFALQQTPNQLHLAQQEINNLRLLNVCLQTTLIRVQTQLIEYLPENINDEIKRNNTRQQLAHLRRSDDHTRQIISNQQFSFFRFFDQPSKLSTNKHISLVKIEKQIDIFHEMFHELHTIIHTEHHDRICQLYITLAQTSQSITQAHEGKKKVLTSVSKYDSFDSVIDKTIDAHRLITKRRLKRNFFFVLLIFSFISTIIFMIIISIRMH